MSSLREVAEARLGNGPRTSLSEFHRLATPEAVLALLDVVDAARSLLNAHAHAPARNGQDDWDEWAHYAEVDVDELLEALARLPEEVRRG